MVILYTQPHCAKCKIVHDELDKANIPYTECQDIAIMREKGFVATPMAEIDGVAYDYKGIIEWIKGQNQTGGMEKYE